jgi:hypothetical protein
VAGAAGCEEGEGASMTLVRHFHGRMAGIGLCGVEGYSTNMRRDVNCKACLERLAGAEKGLSPVAK